MTRIDGLHRYLIRTLCNLLFLNLLLISFSTANAQELPPKQTILAKMTAADDYFMAKWSDTGKEPKDGQPVTADSRPDFEDYGLGCFLLVGSELYKLK